MFIYIIVDTDFGYPGQPNLLKNVYFGIDMESRVDIVWIICVVKSTLIKLLTGDLTPVCIRRGFIYIVKCVTI